MNPFEHWADAEKPHWQQRQEARQRRRAQKLAEVMAEKAELERRYRAVKEEDRGKLMAGPQGAALAELLGYLDTLSLRAGSGQELLGFVRQWVLNNAPDAELMFEALHLIAGAIVSLRESEGLAPFDDPLPWDNQGSVFLELRTTLGEKQ